MAPMPTGQSRTHVLQISPTEANLRLGKRLTPQSLKIFLRLQRFYNTFSVISALISGLSLALLTFSEFHPTNSHRSRLAEGLLIGSIIVSISSVLLGTMLLFGFEGYETLTRRDFTLALTPLVTLALSIFTFIGGLLLWFMEKNGAMGSSFFGSLASGIFSVVSWGAVRIWSILQEMER